MKCVSVRVVIAALAFLNAGVSTAYAEPCREHLIDARVGMIEMRTPVQAEAVSSRESLDVLGDKGERASVLTFQRRVEDFWRYKAERNVDPEDLIVSYDVIDGGDREGAMVHDSVTSAQFPVRLIPHAPRVLCEDRDFRIISGSFTLLARASGIGLAGLYAVEIDVDVEQR